MFVFICLESVSFGAPFLVYKDQIDRNFSISSDTATLNSTLYNGNEIVGNADKEFTEEITKLSPCRVIFTDRSKQQDGSAEFSIFISDTFDFEMYSVH